MQNRLIKGLIIIFSIVIILIVLCIVAIEVGENQLEKRVNAMIGIRVADIDIHPIKATVIVKDLVVEQPDLSIQATQVALTLSLGEIVDLAFTKEKELSQATIELIDSNLVYDDIEIKISSLDAHVKGKVSLLHTNDAHLYSLKATIDEFTYTQLPDALSFQGEKGTLLFVGDIEMSTKLDSITSFITVLDSINIEITQPELLFETGQLSTIPLLNANSGWLQDKDNFKGTSIKASLSSDKKVLKGEGIVIDFPIITLGGKFSCNPTGPFTVGAKVTHLDDSMVDEVNPILMFFGYPIPKEPFTLDIDYSAGERPLLIEMNPLQQ